MNNRIECCDIAASASVAESSAKAACPLDWREILTRQLPHLSTRHLTRFFVRASLLAFRGRFLELHGLERIQTVNDSFILALNHSQRTEAILVPALLAFERQGKLVHFLADWNFLLVPGIALLFRCGEVIAIDRKPAKPKFLNAFRPLLTDREPGFERAKRKLLNGASIGVFPEGTTNRSPRRLLRGYSGAAQLSLATGRPVIPAGIRFPSHAGAGPIPENAPMRIEFGSPMHPGEKNENPARVAVKNWHHQIMREISRLSGKEWHERSSRRQDVA